VRLQITGGDVTKEYLALVRGCFPGGPARIVDAPLRYDYAARRTAVGAGAGSKIAATAIVLLAVSPCGTRSLVACRPLTGRTHQVRVVLCHLLCAWLTRSLKIRAHLEHAGYPIANDSAYGGALGAAASGDPVAGQAAACDAADDAARFAPRPRLAVAGEHTLAAHAGGAHGGESDDLCTHCPWLAPQGQALDVAPLFLHACRYAGIGWSFAAPPPPWAQPLLRPGDGDGPSPDVSLLPLGLWTQLPAEALLRAAAGGGVGEEA
jgi:hypothetical protein